ncbi:MAG: glycosyltransferase family 39 protein [Planctomycetaceae bacterium]|nr:glycosyltransferase family 39 protein [Planctomycetaceae bacterium]
MRTKGLLLASFVFLLAISWLIYDFWGHKVIQAAYDGKSLTILNNLIKYQDTKPVEHYFSVGDNLFRKIAIASPLCLLLIFLLEEGIIWVSRRQPIDFSVSHVRLIFYAALFLRLFCILFAFKLFLVGDEEYYWSLTKNLFAGHFELTIVRPPLWGYVLGIPNLISSNPLASRIFNSLLGSIAPVLVYFLGTLCFSKKTGLVAGLLFAFYPEHIGFSHYLWSEVLFGIFALLSFIFFFYWLKYRSKKAFYFCFAVLSLSLLTKEFTVIFFAAFILILFLKRESVKSFLYQTLASSAVFLLPVALYSLAASLSTNQIVLLNLSPVSNFRYAAGLDSKFQCPQGQERQAFAAEFWDYFMSLSLRERIRFTKSQFYNLWTPNSFPITRLATKPIPDAWSWSYGFTNPHLNVIIAFIAGYYIIIVLLGLAGFCLSDFELFSLCSLLCLSLLSAGSVICFFRSRFRLPFFFIFILFAAEFVVNYRQCAANLKNPIRSFLLTAFCILFVLILIDKIPLLGQLG